MAGHGHVAGQRLAGPVMLTLRLLSAVTPLAIAGLVFGRGPVRAYGIITRPLDQFAEGELRQLFADPRLDISVGVPSPWGDVAYFPAVDLLDLVRLQQLLGAFIEQPSEGRGTEQVLADHARMEAERERDSALAGGDDEKTGTEMAAPAGAEPAPEGLAPSTAAEPETAAVTQPDPEADPAAGAAPPEAAASGEGQAETAADAPGASAATPPEPKRGGKK